MIAGPATWFLQCYVLSIDCVMINFLRNWWSYPASKKCAPSASTFAIPVDRTLLHATHPKAGSQWVQAIFVDLFGAQAVPNEAGNGTPIAGAFGTGKVYLSVYLCPDELANHVVPEAQPTSFFVMRDLRDTLVSLYFSLKVSHAVLDEFMASARKRLNKLSEEDGLIYLIETQLRNSAKLQKTWLAKDVARCVKFESLTANPHHEMPRVIRELLGLDVPTAAIIASCDKFSFERLAGGRKRGEEDAGSHFRSGAAGGWRKHFTPAVTGAFKDEFPGLLVAAGYEIDDNWHSDGTDKE